MRFKASTSQELDTMTGEESALRSLLERSRSHEASGAVIAPGLMRYGLFGSAAVIAAGLLVQVFANNPAGIRESDFYWIFGDTVASLAAFLKPLAVPTLICGSVLLLLGAGLTRIRTSGRWRAVVVMQFAVGSVTGLACAGFLALIMLNLAIWLLMVGAVIALLVAIWSG